jgi:hypothetical protein
MRRNGHALDHVRGDTRPHARMPNQPTAGSRHVPLDILRRDPPPPPGAGDLGGVEALLLEETADRGSELGAPSVTLRPRRGEAAESGVETGPSRQRCRSG